ncbi:MAG: HAD family hydrolase [Oscillospiraceae bacterium]|jgi:Cof subfamily protein (haloacid dehalogenase superfamily)|nr:HAD family hydrolase [Oscillospiraceae bacterium]
MNLSNVYLVADVDGTILDTHSKLPAENLAAIDELREAGGKFTIATGRGAAMARETVKLLKITEPVVIFNGAGVYDYRTEEFLWQSNMPEIAVDYLEIMAKNFPTCAAEVLIGRDVYVPWTNRREEHHLKLGLVTAIRESFENTPKHGWLKSLVLDDPDVIEQMIEFVKENKLDGVHWVRSSEPYYEMLPHGVNKGTGFKRLAQLTGDAGKFVVAMGDYDNDAELVATADLGVAVANARDCVLNVAKYISADNDHTPVREVIEYIKRL